MSYIERKDSDSIQLVNAKRDVAAVLLNQSEPHQTRYDPSTSCHVTLTEDEWEERYKLIPNTLVEDASFGGFMFETYGDELEKIRQTPNIYIWTYQDDDDGNPCITSGYHIINRIGYFISENPWDVDTFVRLDLDVI